MTPAAFGRWFITGFVLASGAASAAAQETALSAVAPPDTPPDARDEPETGTSQDDREFSARLQLLIRTLQLREALELLESRPDIAGRPDAVRLRAELRWRLGDSRAAIAMLEAQVTEYPEDAIARYQLGEIHFAAKHDQAAQFAYRLARAGGLDAARDQIAAARLAEIYARRRWRFWAGGAVAPDSNINAATQASQVELFGLPFDLDADARQTSGVVLSAFGGLERRFTVSENSYVRASLSGGFSDAPGAEFDNASLTASVGPEWRIGRESLFAVQARGGLSWFAGDVLSTREGVSTLLELAGGRQSWTISAAADAIDDRQNDDRDGWAASVDLARTYYLSTSSLWRLGLSHARREADSPTEAYDQTRASVGLLVPAPFAVLAYVEPYGLTRDYEGASVAFGKTRSDREIGISVRFSKRDWILFGAFPFLSLSSVRAESNIPLYDYSRERMEIGFTRDF